MTDTLEVPQPLTSGATAWWQLADTVGSSTAADSAGTYTGTVGSGVTFGQTGGPGGNNAALFNNSVNGITTTLNPSGWTAESVEAWFNLNGVAPTAWPCTIIANSQTDSDHTGINLMLDQSGTNSIAKVVVGNGTTMTYIYGASAVSTSGWHQIAFTWNATSGQLLLFLDGTQISSGTLTGTVTAGVWSPAGFVIGMSRYWPRGFPGLLAQISVFNSVLTPAQILSDYNAMAVTAVSRIPQQVRVRQVGPVSPILSRPTSFAR